MTTQPSTNSDNLLSHVSRIAMIHGKSDRTGNDWSALELYWNKPSGKEYKQRVFLNSEQLSIIEDSVALNAS